MPTHPIAAANTTAPDPNSAVVCSLRLPDHFTIPAPPNDNTPPRHHAPRRTTWRDATALALIVALLSLTAWTITATPTTPDATRITRQVAR